MESNTSRRTLLNYIGIAILLAGAGTGEFIYWRGLQTDTSATDLAMLADSKAYDHQMQVQVGTFGMVIDQITRAIQRPTTLAIVICVVSALAAGACFWLASRMPRG